MQRKDEAAERWCENATDLTDLTDTTWRYLKVPQKAFEDLRPDVFEDLCLVLLNRDAKH